MQANARVLLYSDPTDTSNLAGKLEQRGYQPLAANSHEDALRIVTGRFPDIAIVKAGENGEGARFRHDLNELRPDGGIPTIFIGSASGAAEGELQVEYLPAAFRVSELFSRLKVLARLVTMQGELALRSETSQLYGHEAPTQAPLPQDVSDAKVLVIASDDNQRTAIKQLIAPIGTADVVGQTYEGMEQLRREPFDAVITVGGQDNEELLAFCHQLRNHANLFNIPLLILSENTEAEAQNRVYEAGASEVLRVGAGAARLLPQLQHLVRQQRYRQTMQDVYREGRHYTATDALTGL